MRRLQPPDIGDGGHNLWSHAHSAHALVQRLLDVRHPKGQQLGAQLAASLEIGSYQTAWAMLHWLRSVLMRPNGDRLTGTVEGDETYIGAEEPELRGARARGKKSLADVAVELKQPLGYGRCRMAILADCSTASLHPFVTDHVEPGATVITDA